MDEDEVSDYLDSCDCLGSCSNNNILRFTRCAHLNTTIKMLPL